METCEVSGKDITDYVCCYVTLRFRDYFKGWCAKAEIFLFHWHYQGAYLCVESMDLDLGTCSRRRSPHFLLIYLCVYHFLTAVSKATQRSLQLLQLKKYWFL